MTTKLTKGREKNEEVTRLLGSADAQYHAGFGATQQRQTLTGQLRRH